MALQASGLNDLLKATLESIPKLKMTDITSHLQKHIALSMLMKGSKVVTEPAGVAKSQRRFALRGAKSSTQ